MSVRNMVGAQKVMEGPLHSALRRRDMHPLRRTQEKSNAIEKGDRGEYDPYDDATGEATLITTVVFVLWAKAASTKDFTWWPLEVYTTSQECEAKKTETANDPEKSVDAHGFKMPLKCVRYRIAK
jgi:hypothetical protein